MSRKLLRTLTVSIGLSLLGVLVVVFWLGDTSGLQQLTQLSALTLLLALGLLLLYLVFGGLRLMALVVLTGERAGFLSSVRAFILGLFAAALTPSGGGNAPGIAIAYQRDGVTPASSWSAAIYTTVLDLFFIGYAVPVAAVLLWRDDRIPVSLLVVAIIACLVSLGLWYGLSFHFARLEGLVRGLFSLTFLRRWRGVAVAFLREVAESMILMANGRFIKHLQAHALSLLMHVTLYSILYVFLRALGTSPDYVMVISIITLVTAVSHFIPTPGASGYMEATLAYAFAQHLPGSVVTAAVVAYRAVSYYGAILLGAILGGSLLMNSAQAIQPGAKSAEVRAPDMPQS